MSPGFPELLLCRTCGAALSVEPAAIGTRCAYCRTDNMQRSIVRWVALGSIAGVLGLLTIKLWSQ